MAKLAFREFLKRIQGQIKVYLWPETEKWLVHCFQLLLLLVLGGFGYASYWAFHRIAHPEWKASEEVAKVLPEYDTDSNVGLGESHIPKDILARQDGVPEKGHDLQEEPADQGRGLAALIDTSSEIVVDSGPLYYEVTKVAAGLKREDNHIEAIVETDLSFQVKDRATLAEMEARSIELKALLETLISEFPKEDLLKTSGKYELKKYIMSQLNFRLKNGRVTDVFFSKFRVQ